MKVILLLGLLNTQTGVKQTMEIPMKDFATCLEKQKELGKEPIPEGYKVLQFQCLVGAE